MSSAAEYVRGVRWSSRAVPFPSWLRGGPRLRRTVSRSSARTSGRHQRAPAGPHRLRRGAAESAGVRPNDRVAVVLPDGPDLAAAFLAISSGAVCAPLNPAYTRAELEFYLDDLDVRALVVGAGTDSPAQELAAERGVPVLEPAPLEDEAPRPANRPRTSRARRTSLFVLHTSGTTSSAEAGATDARQPLRASARNISAVLHHGEGDRCLNVMPLFHVHGPRLSSRASSLWSGAALPARRASRRCGSSTGSRSSRRRGTRPCRRCTRPCLRASVPRGRPAGALGCALFARRPLPCRRRFSMGSRKPSACP